MSMGTARQTIHKNGTAVIALGQRAGSTNCNEVQQVCGELQERLEHRQVRNIVVDCADATGLGCSTLGLFLRLWKTARQCDGRFSMCGVSSEDRDVLRLVKLDGLWPIYDSRQEAIDALERRC